MRIGHGYDVHRLVEGRKLILGGVEIPYEKGLLGHSDADVLTHALMDALLGAAALGDIGKLFPDNDDRFLGADSIELLKEVCRLLKEKNHTIGNVDVTVIAQRPKLAPYIPEMRRRLAEAMQLPEDNVNVKATTEEKRKGATCAGQEEEMDIQGIKTLNDWIQASDNVVFFGGAGVSTESGIPDFRSVDGLYHQKWSYPPEEILSHSFFERDPAEYYRFHREKLVIDGVKPNRAHLKLAELEEAGKLRAVITQNIDGLHQAAGSKKVLELHGSILRAYCSRCRKPWPQEVINHGTGIPRCDCGGVIRPDIVLYEEPLDQGIMEEAVHYIRNAEILIIGGTSLNVYPAAGLIRYYRGNKLVLVNLSETPYDSYANLVIHEKIGEVFSQIKV